MLIPPAFDSRRPQNTARRISLSSSAGDASSMSGEQVKEEVVAHNNGTD